MILKHIFLKMCSVNKFDLDRGHVLLIFQILIGTSAVHHMLPAIWKPEASEIPLATQTTPSNWHSGKLKKLQPPQLIDGWTWKVACLFPLCDYSIKHRPVWMAGFNMHGDHLSPLSSISMWSDRSCLFMFVFQDTIHLSTSEHWKSVTEPHFHQSVSKKCINGNIFLCFVLKFFFASLNFHFTHVSWDLFIYTEALSWYIIKTFNRWCKKENEKQRSW